MKKTYYFYVLNSQNI